MSRQLYNDSEVSQFCRHCRLLLIDDKAWGGYRSDRPGESRFLAFDEKITRRHFETEYCFEDLYPDLPSLAESALTGCICCAYIRESILTAKLEPPEGAARVTLKISYLWGSLFADYLYAEMILAPCVRWLRLETSSECDAMNSKNVAWIKRLLNESEQEAVSLGVKRDDRYLPTRLIDVGVGGQGRLPRLVLATDLRSMEARPEYAALSYCWGSQVEAASQYQTTRETLQQRLAQIDIARATSVTKDAVDVCKALGIRYLWVDWEQEAAQMSNVYRNSTVTICSVSSSSHSQGFLEKRSRGIDIPFRSRVSPDIEGHDTIRYSVPGLTDPLVTGYLYLEDLGEGVWATRAWTFQEYHLSRVLLCFGKRKIHIISAKGIMSEGETKYQPCDVPAVSFLETGIAIGGHLNLELAYNHWMEWASEYSSRQFTYPTDKFPALAGLAGYFKGLWQKDLHRQLFWTMNNKERQMFDELFGPQRSSQQFIAPSWSWANQDLGFENGHRYFHMNGSLQRLPVRIC
ncbi:hypothetical protein F4823DRAFT_631862 [Ustulina deusta]|nr:hypothetical protein F4823DRAFT_631862 [Ustulina deusta]